MEASVLPLSWPAGFDPLDYKRFETDARTLRYQALGRACRAARIRKLFFAHHADDQAETVLMRLANNRLRSGLQAMQPVEWIPECYGMHGIAHSGNHQNNNKYSPGRRPFPVEDGGIRILRPLLGFEKSRLIATCEQHDVAWAEDKTNHLQTYTSRNAVRHVLKNHKLPAALSIRSLVDVSHHMQSRVNRHKHQAKQLLDSCFKALNLQSGSLCIRFPSFVQLLPKGSSLPPTQSELNEARNVACCLLEQVGQLISPRESAPLGDLAATIGNIWPEFFELEDVNMPHTNSSGNRTNFCIYSVWWRKSIKPLNETFNDSVVCGGTEVHPLEWLLTRQPLEQHRSGVASKFIQYPPSHILPLTQDVACTPISVADNEYQLFDGRWWISLQNRSADVLTLRIFTKDDHARLHSLHDAKRGGLHPDRFIATALSMLEPTDVRFTLPAVFRRDRVTKEETLVGFPTLNVSMGQLGFPKDVCSWRVRYKKVGLSEEQLLKNAARHITHERIERKLAGNGERQKRVDNTKDVRTDAATGPSQSFDEHRGKRQNRETKPSKVKKERSSSRKATPLVPVAESYRHGRSEKREGGGYNVKWRYPEDTFKYE